MPTFKDFKLPDLGEGLTEGEILKWFVAPGDEVKLNQPIVEVETAKAAVEIPSPYAGIVTALHHGEGDTVDVGSPIITFDVDPGGAATDDGVAAPAQTKVAAAAGMVPQLPHEPGLSRGPAPKANTEEKIEVLVGSGPKSGKLTRRARKSDVAPAPISTEAPAAPARPAVDEIHVLANPPVLKLARDLGVDLTGFTGSGPGGTVTRADVEAAANGPAPRSMPAADGTRERRIPIKGVVKMMAGAMVESAFTAPH